MDDNKQKWNDFFDHEKLKFSLTFMSTYIAVFENFKETMVSNSMNYRGD